MPRDYKHRTAARKKPARKPRPTWIPLLTGFSGGLAVALLVHLYHVGALAPWTARAAAAIAAPIAAKAPAPKSRPRAREPKPRFEFYTLLPEMEVVVPEREVAVAVAAPRPAAKRGRPESYYLQAGSFRGLEDADRLKASLALLGFEAEIQTVSVNGANTWHRVRLGPFSDLAEVQAARTRLRANNVATMVLKVKV